MFSVLKTNWGQLLCLHLVLLFFNQTLALLQLYRMETKSEDFTALMICVGLTGFFVQSIARIISVGIIIYVLQNESSPISQVLKNLHQNLIETLKAFFKSINYSFLFLIPGLIKMLQYQFVSFIAFEDKHYLEGKIDALLLSQQLTRKHFFSFALLIFFFILIGLPFSSNPSLLESPVKVLIYEPILFFLAIYQTIYCFRLYQDLKLADSSKDQL